jgi:hypothetical protein
MNTPDIWRKLPEGLYDLEREYERRQTEETAMYLASLLTPHVNADRVAAAIQFVEAHPECVKLNLGIAYGSMPAFEFVLDRRFNSDTSSAKTIEIAGHSIKGVKTRLDQVILESGMKPEVCAPKTMNQCTGNYPLHVAACAGYVDTVRMVLLANPEAAMHINEAGETPLLSVMNHCTATSQYRGSELYKLFAEFTPECFALSAEICRKFSVQVTETRRVYMYNSGRSLLYRVVSMNLADPDLIKLLIGTAICSDYNLSPLDLAIGQLHRCLGSTGIWGVLERIKIVRMLAEAHPESFKKDREGGSSGDYPMVKLMNLLRRPWFPTAHVVIDEYIDMMCHIVKVVPEACGFPTFLAATLDMRPDIVGRATKLATLVCENASHLLLAQHPMALIRISQVFPEVPIKRISKEELVAYVFNTFRLIRLHGEDHALDIMADCY